MLLFVNGEDVPGARGQIPRHGDIRKQHEATHLLLPPTDALGVGLHSSLQSVTHGFDRAWLVGARPAPAIHGLFLHRDVHQMVGGMHGAELRRRRFGIGAAEILLLLSSARDGLECALRGLEVTFQALLLPFILRAGVHHDRPIGPPIERDLALRGFIGCPRTVLGRLRVGEDADLCPGVVRHGLGNEPPALVIRGG